MTDLQILQKAENWLESKDINNLENFEQVMKAVEEKDINFLREFFR